jgi:hypothetical protein
MTGADTDRSFYSLLFPPFSLFQAQKNGCTEVHPLMII